MEKFEQKMKAEGLSQAAIDAFRLNYEQLVAGVTGLVRLTFGDHCHLSFSFAKVVADLGSAPIL